MSERLSRSLHEQHLRVPGHALLGQPRAKLRLGAHTAFAAGRRNRSIVPTSGSLKPRPTLGKRPWQEDGSPTFRLPDRKRVGASGP